MSCLAHDIHYSSSLQAVINELRKENSVPIQILRSIPRQCCTCRVTDNEQIDETSGTIENKDQLKNFQKLSERVAKEKLNNPRLSLSFSRLESIIKKSRTLPEPEVKEETNSRKSTQKQKEKPKTEKSIRKGTFLFLPYQTEESEGSTDSLNEDEKQLQRARFIGRKNYVRSLESRQNVVINMITPTTKQTVKDALERAQKGEGKFQIPRAKSAENQEGEWILIRPKIVPKQRLKSDFQAVIDALNHRWETCLTITERFNDDQPARKKRRSMDDDDNEEEEEEEEMESSN